MVVSKLSVGIPKSKILIHPKSSDRVKTLNYTAHSYSSYTYLYTSRSLL